MKHIGIWFTQGYSNLYNALSDIRSADVENKFLLVCSHPHAQFVGKAAADVYVEEPPKGNADYLDFALNVVRTHNVKVIVPSRNQAFFNTHAAKFRELGATVATVASTRTLRRVDDKAELYDALVSTGLANIPAYQRASTADEVREAHFTLKALGYKTCIKPTRGVYGSGFRVLKETPATLADLLAESATIPLADLCARMKASPGKELLVMQLLEGDERSVDCLAVRGQLVAAVTRRKSASAVAPQVIESNPEVLTQVKALVKHLKLNGLFNVQFRDHKGRPFLLEINTRLSGRSYYATAAGVNLPYLAAQVFSGEVAVDQLAVPEPTAGLLLGNVSAAVDLGAGEPSRSSTLAGRESH